jgi:hypothetical protein
MSTAEVTIEGHALQPDGRVSVRIRGLAPGVVQPGQAFAAFQPGRDLHCQALIPTNVSATDFSAPLPDGVDWPPGTRLLMHGPFGKGFRPPSSSRHWLLMSFGGAHAFLQPLIRLGLEQGRELALFADDPAPGMPPAVEVLPEPEDGLPWADYVAVGLPLTRLDEMIGRLKQSDWQLRRKMHDEVLAVSSLPCGIGGCRACHVGVRGHRQLICVDGPLIPLTRLFT